LAVGKILFTVSSKSALVNGLGSVASDSFTKHFCHDEDDEGSKKATTGEEINQGETSGTEHRDYCECNHR